VSARKKESAKAVGGSEKARRHAAVILEVLAGLMGPMEASQAMGVSPNRYYQLEARGLEGLVRALEPRPRGRRTGPEVELVKMKAENERLSREVVRLTSLVRASRRSLGVAAPGQKKAAAGKRKRKPSHRGKKVVALLRKPAQDEEEPGEARAS
jgi:hypothetical protein